MKIAAGIFIVVIVLSVLTWWFFFASGDPLTSPETTVVVGVYLIAALAVRRLWTSLYNRRRKR